MCLSVSVPFVKGDRMGTWLRGLQGMWHFVQVCLEGCYVCENVLRGGVATCSVKFLFLEGALCPKLWAQNTCLLIKNKSKNKTRDWSRTTDNTPENYTCNLSRWFCMKLLALLQDGHTENQLISRFLRTNIWWLKLVVQILRAKKNPHEVHKNRPTEFQRAGVPSSQALPGFLITAPPSVCVPDVIGALTVRIQNQERKEKKGGSVWSPGQPAVVPGCGEFWHCWRRDCLVGDAPVTTAVTQEPSDWVEACLFSGSMDCPLVEKSSRCTCQFCCPRAHVFCG